jgi:hypothetical protein
MLEIVPRRSRATLPARMPAASVPAMGAASAGSGSSILAPGMGLVALARIVRLPRGGRLALPPGLLAVPPLGTPIGGMSLG